MFVSQQNPLGPSERAETSWGQYQLRGAIEKQGVSQPHPDLVQQYFLEMVLSNPDSIDNYLLRSADQDTFGAYGPSASKYVYPDSHPVNRYLNLHIFSNN